MPAAPPLGVLRDANFRRFYAGRTASLIGDGVAPVALAFAVFDLTGSATDLGLVLAAHSLVIVALILVGGVAADRLSPRVAMLGADFTRAASTGLMAVLLLSGTAEIWQLALLYAVDGAAAAFFNPASDSIVPQVAPGPRLQEAAALVNLSRSVGQIGGPALAGLLLALGSPGAALAVDAASFLFSALCLIGVRAPRLGDREGEGFVESLRLGWNEFSSRTWLWVIVASAAFTNAIFFAAFQVLGPAVAKADLGGSSAWAVIATANGVGALGGGVLALSLRPRRPLLAGEISILLIAVPVALLALPAATAAIAIGSLLAGFATSFGSILYETTVAQQVPTAALSRVMAYDWFGSLALEPLGLALIGPLAAGLGGSETLWLCAGALLLCQGAVVATRDVRRVEARPEGPPPLATSRAPVRPGE